MMKISDFQNYIDLYGADLSRWPQQEIRAAIDLIQHNPEAGKIFSAAEKLDQMLRHYPAISVNTRALAEKIIRQTSRPAAATLKSFRLNPAYLFVPGGGLLVAAMLGFMIGFNTVTETKQTRMLESVLYTQDHIIDVGVGEGLPDES